jgi:hypothetical protein
MSVCLYCGDKLGVIKIQEYSSVNCTMSRDQGRQVYRSVWSCKKKASLNMLELYQIISLQVSDLFTWTLELCAKFWRDLSICRTSIFAAGFYLKTFASARFEFVTAELLKVQFFKDITLCCWANSSIRFECTTIFRNAVHYSSKGTALYLRRHPFFYGAVWPRSYCRIQIVWPMVDRRLKTILYWEGWYIMCLLFTSYCQDDKINFEIRITRVDGCKSWQLHTIWKPGGNRGVESPFEDR